MAGTVVIEFGLRGDIIPHMTKIETPEMAALQHHLNRETFLASLYGLFVVLCVAVGPQAIIEAIDKNDTISFIFGSIVTLAGIGNAGIFKDHMVDMNKTITDIEQLKSHYN